MRSSKVNTPFQVGENINTRRLQTYGERGSMAQTLDSRHVDVLVIGGGSAGVATALAAKKSGANTLLVEAGPYVGGELVSGLPIDGCLNSRGEWIVGGVSDELFEGCKELDGYVGALCDYRLINAVCLDPDVMKLVVQETLADEEVPLLLYTFAEDVVVDDDRVEGVVVMNKSGRTVIDADVVVDCSGDGDVAIQAGADYEKGSAQGEFQPVTLVFQMANVDYDAYLEFVRDNPEEFILAEHPVYPDTKKEAAQALYEQGQPFAGPSAEGQLLSEAIKSGEMFETMGIYMWPTNVNIGEVGLNTTRVANLDATNTEAVSESLKTLTDQVKTCVSFVKGNIPGFEDAHLSGIAPRVGIRETRRVIGEHLLTKEEVVEARKSDQGIAKGGHHVDVHGSGTDQEREPVADGGSYDIPYGCLMPRDLENVLVAGRCISADREAFGSVRVMGQCMATGQAAGVAATMCAESGWEDVRDVPVEDLRERLREMGAVLEGTH